MLLGGLLIGWSPILVRLSPLGPLATAFWRLALACLPLVAVFLYGAREEKVGKIPRRAGEHLQAALPGVSLAADLAAWQISLHLTSVANSTLLANMAPIFTTLGGWLIWRHSVSRAFLSGLAVSIVGIVVLRGGPSAIAGGNLRGDALALLAAVFYAGYFLAAAHARKEFSAVVIMLWSTIAAALCTLPLAVAFEPALLPVTLGGLGVLVALAWVVHAGGQGVITYALAWLRPSFSALTLLIQPVVAALLAWMLLGERLGGWQVVGGSIIIGGIILAKRG